MQSRSYSELITLIKKAIPKTVDMTTKETLLALLGDESGADLYFEEEVAIRLRRSLVETRRFLSLQFLLDCGLGATIRSA